MYNTVVMGGTGTGKTETSKDILNSSNVGFVFDFQNSGDWDHLPKFDPRNPQKKCRVTPSMGYDYKGFIKLVEKFYFNKGATIIMEEAKCLFPSNQLDPEINRFLISCRHNMVNFVFLFHSAGQIPPFILTFTDIVVIKRVDGEVDMLKKKFNKKVWECQMECKKDPKKTFTLGVSGKADGLFFVDTFKGKSLKEKVLSGEINEDFKKRLYSKNNGLDEFQ